MRTNRVKTQSYKKKNTEDITLQNNKKINSESLEIIKGITLQIVNTKVEKAKKNIYGNYIYKVN